MNFLQNCKTVVWVRILVVFWMIWGTDLLAQNEQKFKIHGIGFYNLENLFDTINDPLKNDEASPIMEITENQYAIYQKKLKNMARAISDIGVEHTGNTPVILGVAEVENKGVLVDLVNQESLLAKDYGIIHFDSPDGRGIDVGLLYQKAFFKPTSSKTYTLRIFDDADGTRVRTRDQLLVSGYLEDELLHCIVNHWPSRRGGEARSAPKRMAAARLTRRIIDSLQSVEPYAKILVMGDFNDNPTDYSIKDGLKAIVDRSGMTLKTLYNPFEKMYQQGLGTTGYRDKWYLFDQVLMAKALVDTDASGWRYYRAGIFNKSYLTNSSGKYKGYPYRSFASGAFTGGYSDHYPVYVYLIKPL